MLKQIRARAENQEVALFSAEGVVVLNTANLSVLAKIILAMPEILVSRIILF